jgi:glycosyltransferase involved in cell wall biosynthesis
MISIVIPASNEEKSIKDTLSGLKGVLLEHKVPHEIILVDDGSDDKTVENAIEIPDVRVIHHPERRGYGAALKRGILNAIGDWILIIDADASYPANEVPKILKHIGDYDMVVGSRVGL